MREYSGVLTNIALLPPGPHSAVLQEMETEDVDYHLGSSQICGLCAPPADVELLCAGQQ